MGAGKESASTAAAAESTASDVLLEGRELRIAFGGVRALDGMSFAVRRGSITGMIGPNGAGKSTLFNAVSGVIQPAAGQTLLFGENVTGWPSHRLAKRGLIRTFQLSRELAGLTVIENLMLAPQGQLGERLSPLFLAPGAVRRRDREILARAEEVLVHAKLAQVRDEYARDLSGGQKKLLELARALMIDSEVILLDEPGAGVNPALMQTLMDLIVSLNREHGKTFLIVEHDMDLIARLCDPVIVMTDGSKLLEGDFETVRRDPRVIEAYLGGGAVEAGGTEEAGA